MNETMQQELFTRLDAIAAKLGVAAESMWEVLVQQAVLNAWMKLGALVALWSVLAIGLRFVSKLSDENAREFDTFSPRVVGYIVCGIYGVAGPFAGLFALGPGIITGFFNPEYAALRELLDAVR